MAHFQVRYDEELGIYRDCPYCHGSGCLFCPGEADDEYHRQFPDGPQPIATFDLSSLVDRIALKLLFHDDVLRGLGSGRTVEG